MLANMSWGQQEIFLFLLLCRINSQFASTLQLACPCFLIFITYFFRWYITVCHKGPSLSLTDGLTVVARFNAHVSLDSVGQGGIWA